MAFASLEPPPPSSLPPLFLSMSTRSWRRASLNIMESAVCNAHQPMHTTPMFASKIAKGKRNREKKLKERKQNREKNNKKGKQKRENLYFDTTGILLQGDRKKVYKMRKYSKCGAATPCLPPQIACGQNK